MAANLFGTPMKRKEDPKLITGQASYIDDMILTDMYYAVFVRSIHAHAKIISINIDKAKNYPDVVAVYTGEDLKGKVNSIPTAWPVPDCELKTPAHPPLATDKVRYLGDAVAVIVAKSREAAYDATEGVEIDYETLPAVVDLEKAITQGQPLVHDDAPNNQALHWKITQGDVEQAFAQADVVVKQRMTNNRLAHGSIETRGCIAQYNRGSSKLTLWMTSQNPHIHRFLLSLILNLPEHHIRVITPEIGGAFGSKIPCYPDEAVISFCSMQTGKPVKWVEDRRENLMATAHGRDHVVNLEAAVKKDGTLLAIRGTCYANAGAYISTASPGVITILHGLMMCGCYKFPAIDYHIYGVFTNTTPIDALRGAGRPEATYYVERLMDLIANTLNMDPVEVRRRSFIPKEQFPYTVATGLVYDSGDYEAALNKALINLGYDKFRQEQEEARKQGKLIGIGLSTYVEICGLGPSKVAGAVGFGGGLWESALVRMLPTGKVTVMTGTNPHGQGEETTFAQLVAQRLGLQVEDVEVLHGDTDLIPMGWGTYGSRTTVVGGAAIAKACDRIIAKGKKISAHLLETGEEEIVFEEGRFYSKTAPDKSKTIQDIALEANVAWHLSETIEPGLEAEAFYDPENFVYPFGTHICVVQIDSETGEIRIQRYIAVDDIGHVINPMIVDGQIHGGVAHGIAQALYEEVQYDESGQLLTGSFSEYAIPKAYQLPTVETDKTETPSPHNPLGVKGVGETGTIASTAAVANAVMDALRPFGINHLDMPFTPQRIWEALKQAKKD